VRSALIGVVFEEIPGAEHELIEGGERSEFFDERCPVFRAFAEADSGKLGERSDRLGQTPPSEQASGDECRRDGSEARQEDAERSVGGLDL
jgi:hypothetical protein